MIEGLRNVVTLEQFFKNCGYSVDNGSVRKTDFTPLQEHFEMAPHVHMIALHEPQANFCGRFKNCETVAKVWNTMAQR